MRSAIYFMFWLIAFFSCKPTGNEQPSMHKTSIQDTSLVQSVLNESAPKVSKTIIKSPKNNGLVDSLIFFGTTVYDKEFVDSFYIYFRNGNIQRIIIEKDEEGFSNYFFTIPDDEDNILRHFNPDSYIDLVFTPAYKAPAQLSWSIVYLYNRGSNSFELAEHLTYDGLEYNENIKEYVQKMKNGLGRYGFTRYRITGNSDSLSIYEYFYIEHDFEDKMYDKKFYIEYENYDTNIKYKDTCRIKITDCKVKYISCNASIYNKLKQTWIDFYTVKDQLEPCPELDL